MPQSFLSLPVGGITDLVASGQCFWYKTAAAGVTAAVAGANSAPMIWNPSDSGTRLRILEVRIGAVSGTVILGHLAYGLLSGAGAQIGTAQPVVSYTAGTAANANLNKGLGSVMKFAPATVTMTVGPAYFMPSGFSSGGALAAGSLYTMIDPVMGSIVINPGDAFFPYISNAALALVAAVAVLGWEEVIPAGGAR